MKNEAFISIYLDTRRAKSNGKYPVKLRVFTPTPRVQKLYPTKFEYSIEEFDSIWKTTKPRNEHKAKRHQLQEIELNAIEVVDGLETFTFEQFEKKLFRNTGDGTNVFYQYERTVEDLTQSNQLGTASTYKLGLKTIKAYLKHKTGRDTTTLHFTEITANWLNEYERYMIETMGRSHTTVSMYVRTLRTIFNIAIQDRDIDKEIYPFGKGKYKVPSVKNVKKALTKEQLGILYRSVPKNTEQEKAKDFWFFSYVCNGMNIKDIAQLKWENIHEDSIEFLRAKTIKTSKANLKAVHVVLTDHSKKVIKKYGSKSKEKDQLIFPFIASGKNEQEKFNKIKNFTKFINHNIKKLAQNNGITGDISTYWARHSFATNAVRLGASMEFVSEALNHSDLRTTQGYFAGFEEADKKELMDKIMAF
jgi:integrase/recombinase XerD